MLATQRYYYLALAVFLVIVSFSFFLFEHGEPVAYTKVWESSNRTTTHAPTLRDTIVALFDSIRVDPKAASYRDSTGKIFSASSKTTWTEPLKKKVLIVDIDTRVPTGLNQILNPDTLDWESLEMRGGQLVSAAVMNHYLYAQIHGYDYKLYSARSIPEHYDTWIMPHVFHELIPDYDFVVAMDADVTVSHLEVPLEWMFNRWGITHNTSIALPWDTEEFRNNISISTDSSGLRVLNTGFVVAQNLPTTTALLAAWKDCTSDTRYPGCSRWKQEWSHEQRAFSEYIRHDPAFNSAPDSIVPISCDDAVGWPGFKEDAHLDYPITDCSGNFLRHHTLMKEKVKPSASASVMQALAQVLQSALITEGERVWYQEPERNENENENENENDDDDGDGSKSDDEEDANDDEKSVLPGLALPEPQEIRKDPTKESVPVLE